MIFLRALWGRVWPYIAGTAGLIAGLFYVRQSGKAAGRAEIKQEQATAAAEQRRKASEADTKLAQSDDADIRRRLGDWVRDDDR